MPECIGRLRFIVLALMLTTGITAAAELPQPTIHAAGSLRASIDDIVRQFAAQTGITFAPSYGPSGKLRSDIEAGTKVDVFASASTEHTDALFHEGLLRNSLVFARNSLCLLAAPGVDIAQGDLIAKMLEPAMRVGTSTPKMDPGGDYAWMLFRNADKVTPGAYDQLDKKALRLVGNPALPSRAVSDLLGNHEIDLFVTYCSYAEQTASQVTGVTWRKFPEEVNVTARYGIGVAAAADYRSNRLLHYILSPAGQKILAAHGLEPVKPTP